MSSRLDLKQTPNNSTTQQTKPQHSIQEHLVPAYKNENRQILCNQPHPKTQKNKIAYLTKWLQPQLNYIKCFSCTLLSSSSLFPLCFPISFHVGFFYQMSKQTKTAQTTSHHLISPHYIGLISWETTYLTTLGQVPSHMSSSWLAFCMYYVCIPYVIFPSLEKSSTSELKHAFDGKPNWVLRLSYIPTLASQQHWLAR